MHVAREDLRGGDDRRHPHRHREHCAGVRIGFVLEQVPRPHRADHEGGGEVGRHNRVDEAIGKARVEDDRGPAVARHELAVLGDEIAGRGLHPAVHAENPEGRNESAERHHQRCGEVQLLAHLVHPEQHHTEEACLKEEGGQHLVGHQRADHRPGLVRKHRPVGAELVGHDDPRDDAHGKGNREDLQPVLEQVEIDALARLQPEPFEHRKVTGEPDREGREEEMEAHRKGELDPCKQQGVEVFQHGQELIPWLHRSIAIAAPDIRFEAERVAPPDGIGGMSGGAAADVRGSLPRAPVRF